MRVQVVELTLSDGRVVAALFPAFADGASQLAIRSVKVFESYEDDSIVSHRVEAGLSRVLSTDVAV